MILSAACFWTAAIHGPHAFSKHSHLAAFPKK
jgi:hypothetical protein